MRYLRCPQCGHKRVTRREFSDGNGYACDYRDCWWSVYIEEPGDQPQIEALAAANPDATIQRMYVPSEEDR